jgi:DNA polymerase-3 subunit alpha
LPEPRLSAVEDWLPAGVCREEFKAVGFYLSGHPPGDYMAALKRTEKSATLDEVTARPQSSALVAKMGTVAGRQERKSAQGNRFAFVHCPRPPYTSHNVLGHT